MVILWVHRPTYTRTDDVGKEKESAEEDVETMCVHRPDKFSFGQIFIHIMKSHNNTTISLMVILYVDSHYGLTGVIQPLWSSAVFSQCCLKEEEKPQE